MVDCPRATRSSATAEWLANFAALAKDFVADPFQAISGHFSV
jgi:hypothetical protein